jgi:hypothetical protein
LSERKRKEKKARLLSFAFFRFLLVFGIGTFQWVTSEKSEKIFPFHHSPMRLQADVLNARTPPLPAGAGRREGFSSDHLISINYVSVFRKTIRGSYGDICC